MKKQLSFFLILALTLATLTSLPWSAEAAEPIAIMVELNDFDTDNVGGDADSTLLWKKGHASLAAGNLNLTNNNWQAGSVVKRNQVQLTDGFSTYFQLYFSGSADGIAFVIYKADEPKLGDNGGALGYGWKKLGYYGADPVILASPDNSIKDSIIVEFDTWQNYGIGVEQYDPDLAGYDQHVAIMLDGNQVHNQQSVSAGAIKTNAGLVGQTINAWVDYTSGDGATTTGTVTVTFGTGATRADGANHTISRTILISDAAPLAGDNVFVGFTASTGNNATTHRLNKWYFKDTYVAGGLNPDAGTYEQAPATVSVVPNAATNPTGAAIRINDAAGTALPNKTFTVYIDDTEVPEPAPGDYDTGAGALYTFDMPALVNGNHTIRIVGQGGVTNFATFLINKHTVTYNGNGHTGGTVPATSSYNDGDTVTVSANSGGLVKTGNTFAGWNTQADGGGTSYPAGTGQIVGIAGDVDLFAQWNVAPGGGGGGGSSSGGSSNPAPVLTPAPAPENVIVIINGQIQNAGTETKTTEGGRPTVTVAVTRSIAQAKIAEAVRNNPSGIGNTFEVPVGDTSAQIANVNLTGDIVKQLENNAFNVSIKRDKVEYLIPAAEFTISEVAEKLGVREQNLYDIKVEIKMARLDERVIDQYNQMVQAGGAALIFPPMAFKITATVTETNGTVKQVDIQQFSNYVSRIIELPAGTDPTKITTGVVFNPDGTYSHVPTEVFQENGKWYAKLNSLTNSTYGIIWHPLKVASVAGHWSENTVNNLASRLVIFNAGSFVPDQAITRGDFAEYIVRALGLYRPTAGLKNNYLDGGSFGQRTQAILIASEYGIVGGYPNGTFLADRTITREEAMAMYARAMRIANLVGYETDRYQNYHDYPLVSKWASKSVREALAARVFNGTSSVTISPQANLTYAEAASAIKNLLVAAKLINR
jgi:hypothetical protein